MEISIRKAGKEDVDTYLRLLHAVKAEMAHPEWFFIDTDEETREMMEDGSLTVWFAEDGGRLAGAFSIIEPGMEPFNLGYDIGLDAEALARVIHMDTAAVSPAYRGLGLQKRLMEVAEGELRQRDRRILLCTVHPDNRYSLENVLRQGYTKVKRAEKYGSVRYILRKDLP